MSPLLLLCDDENDAVDESKKVVVEESGTRKQFLLLYSELASAKVCFETQIYCYEYSINLASTDVLHTYWVFQYTFCVWLGIQNISI
jgi:hypothetical protein